MNLKLVLHPGGNITQLRGGLSGKTSSARQNAYGWVECCSSISSCLDIFIER